MGKYYDRLVQINENLTNELEEKGIEVSEYKIGDCFYDRTHKKDYTLTSIDPSLNDSNRLSYTFTSDEGFGFSCDKKYIEDNMSKVGSSQSFNEEDEDMVPVPADSLTDDQKQGILADTVKNAGLKVDQKVLDDISKNPEQLAGVQKILGVGDGQKNESHGNDDLSEMDWDGPAIIRKQNDDGEEGFYVSDKEWSTDIQTAYEFPSKEDANDKVGELEDVDTFIILPASMKRGETIDGEEIVDESEDAIILRMDDDDLDIHGFVKWDIEEKVDFVDDEKDADVFDTKADAKSMILDICDKFNYDPETFSIQYKNSMVNDSENWISLDPTNGQATTLS